MSLQKSLMSLHRLITASAILLMVIFAACKKEKTTEQATIIQLITVKTSISKTEPLSLTLPASVPKGAIVKWKLIPSDSTTLTDSVYKVTISAKKPGQYLVIAILNGDSLHKYEKVITVTDVAYQPGKQRLKAITLVRTGQTYLSLNAAVNAAITNDSIEIPAGLYTNDFVNINKSLTIVGIGGMAHFIATIAPPNGKAIFLANADIKLDHIEMSGSAVADMNGAGIKQETGNLTLTYCYFHDNQDGVLTNAVTTGITVTNCEFAHNGAGDGYSHNIYIGATAQAVIRSSYFHDAVVGHEIKCRALNSLIEMCRIQNGSGSASYCIDLPQGGAAIVRQNFIEKGQNAQNPTVIHYGGEAVNQGSSLQVSSNTVLVLKAGDTFVNNQMADGTTALLSNNSVFGLTDNLMLAGMGSVLGTVHLGTQPAVDRSSLFHL